MENRLLLSDTLLDELRNFDPDVPLESAWLPPSAWYLAPEVFDVERRSVFRNNWLIAARDDQLRKPGDYVAGHVCHEPYVVVRGEDGALRAFYNVCRHHAAQVMLGEGCTEIMQCPYHGWTYGLDGRLKSAPELGGVRDFDRGAFGLVPMHVAEWGPFVFISMTDDPAPLAPQLDTLNERLEEMNVRDLTFVARREYTMKCNWKVYVDNYLDGGYHVSYLHKGLAGQLNLDTYRTEVFERYSIQSTAGVARKADKDGMAGPLPDAPGTDFAERVGERALYAYLYPNMMINRYGDMMDTNWVLPVDHQTTRVIFDYYFLYTDSPEAKAFVEASLSASDVVQVEDVDISESVQLGLRSSSYDKGRYSVKREAAEFHFHKLLYADFQPVVSGLDG